MKADSRLHIPSRLLSRFLRPSVTLAASLASAAAHAEPAAAPVHEVPATSDWGMLIMVVLLLTASTFALYGGGMLQRSMAGMRTGPLDTPVGPAPRKRRKPRRKRTAQPKFRRAERDQSLQRRQAIGRHVARSSQSKKRRDGPGIRG